MAKPKVLLVGWDAADWKIINPLLDAGTMPTLNAFVDEGVIGNLASIQPMLSPMLWNSIATGKRPEKHGIFGFVEPDTVSAGVRPVSSTSRHAKAIWNILSQQGLKAHVVGWFAGHPAEPVNGVSVSDLFPYARGPLSEPWPLPTGSVHPDRLRDIFAGLRVHPGEIGSEAILSFVPRAAEVDTKERWRIAALAKILAETATIQNCATWILENEEWDFAAVYFNGIDHFCHGFMDCYPPALPHVSPKTFELFADVVAGAYRFHDMILDRLLQLASPETIVLLVSDHGFHNDHLRPVALPRVPAAPAAQHRAFGIVAMRGPRIRRDERIYGASLLDIAPTVLSLFDLPVGRDMDGRVLVNAFERPPEVRLIPSWEQVVPLPGMSAGMHSPEMRLDPEAAQAVIDQFVALGYVQENSDQKTAVTRAVRELKYNRSRALMDERKPGEALPLLETLCSDWPEELRFRESLGNCYIALGRTLDARNTLRELLDFCESMGKQQREPENPETAKAAKSSLPGLRGREQWLMGQILAEEGDRQGALDCFLRAESAFPLMPGLHTALGGTYLKIGRTPDAKRAFQRALEIDPESSVALLGLAQCSLRLGDYEKAAECALAAVGLHHFLPAGHFVLGTALARMGHFERAILALEMAVSLAPGMLNAHRMLLAIHKRAGGDKHQAAKERDIVQELGIQRSRQSGAWRN